MGLLFNIKQILKMSMQKIYMPALYWAYSRQNIEKGLVLFCDCHNQSMPFSMQRMYDEVKALSQKEASDICVEEWITDFSHMGYTHMLKWIKAFMKRYAAAEYVFMCDNFLPVSSCKKRSETKVIQLWHSGGLLKKFGYDTKEDIPAIYKGNVYSNYDLLTVSAPCCVPVLSSAMRLAPGIAQATGVSRTDYYFDDEWNANNRDEFYRRYPDAVGRKVILWAPTFRGNAAHPELQGMDGIIKAIKQTSDKYFWIIKLHPHLEGKGMSSNCDLPCEKLFCVTDLMITDYSSVLFDYMAYGRPFVLYAPDYQEFTRTRGFYVDYDSYPTTVVKDEAGLVNAIDYEIKHRSSRDIEKCYEYHMSACDGNATRRILERTGLI